MSVMQGNNLNGNRVQHDNTSQNAGANQPEKYQSKKEREKQSAQEGVQKAGKTAGAAVGAYFGGSAGAKVGAKVGDAIGKSKLGQQIGKNVAKNPLARKALSKANDSGALDLANKATDIATSSPQGGGMAGPNSGSTGGLPNGSSNGISNNTSNDSSGDSVLNKRPSKPDFLGNDSNDSEGKSKPGMFSGIISGNVGAKLAIGGFLFGGFMFLIFFIGIAQGSGVISSYDDAFGVSQATGSETGGVDYSTSDPKAKAFFDRVSQVKNSFQSQGKSFNAVYISAVYAILNRHDAKLSYDEMTTGVITDIANAMFSGNSFSEDTFKQNLVSSIFPKYLPGKSQKTYESMAEEVIKYYEDYQSLIGATASNCASLGSCVYEIKGFYLSDRGNVTQNMSITDLQVRLMQCSGSFGGGNWNQPLADEELVPFEQYVLGVAYQEIGPSSPDEAIKAQMVAARSFSLARPLSMGNANGKKLAEENGQWILQLSSCVADQVYCNPNLGCSAMNDGEQYGTVRSGVDHPVKLKDPLPADHKMRTLANDTMGEVLVNEQGNIIYTNYASKIQNQFISLANQGLDYKQILLQVYGASNIDKMSCNTGSGGGCNSTGSTGPYSGWKQADPAWGNITIGNTSQTIAGVGCLATSVSMLIAKSGVTTTVDGDFNPGSFVKKLSATGGFSGANLVWGAVSNAAPNFVYQNKVYVAGQSQSQKLSAIKNLLDQGYYVVAEVKGNTGQHWVAVDGVNGNTVLMMDPASQSTNMWQQYNWENTSQLAYFKVTS